VACKQCNSEKRRDDSLKVLSLAGTGWSPSCPMTAPDAIAMLTCVYWKSLWEAEEERKVRLSENLGKVRSFRLGFSEFEKVLPALATALPPLLTKLYSDCQTLPTRRSSLSWRDLSKPRTRDARPHNLLHFGTADSGERWSASSPALSPSHPAVSRVQR